MTRRASLMTEQALGKMSFLPPHVTSDTTNMVPRPPVIEHDLKPPGVCALNALDAHSFLQCKKKKYLMQLTI